MVGDEVTDGVSDRVIEFDERFAHVVVMDRLYGALEPQQVEVTFLLERLHEEPASLLGLLGELSCGVDDLGDLHEATVHPLI